MTVVDQTRAGAAQALLLAHNAEHIDHPGGNLLQHLIRVRAQLAQWGAATELQLAGLCHAMYGTDGFGVALLRVDQRQVLIDVIGVEAESLVYLYGSCDRSYVYPQLDQAVVEFRDRFTGVTQIPTPRWLQAFVELTAANELDVLHRSPQLAAAHGPALQQMLGGAGQQLSPLARQAWRSLKLPAGL